MSTLTERSARQCRASFLYTVCARTRFERESERYFSMTGTRPKDRTMCVTCMTSGDQIVNSSDRFACHSNILVSVHDNRTMVLQLTGKAFDNMCLIGTLKCRVYPKCPDHFGLDELSGSLRRQAELNVGGRHLLFVGYHRPASLPSLREHNIDNAELGNSRCARGLV